MPKIPGISANQAVRAFMKAGFVILRQGSHIVISNGHVRLTIPRHNPINAYAMGAIAEDAGFSPRIVQKSPSLKDFLFRALPPA
jgi:predicted RNA binding protein YcfA (HicA-like mRNA interferase family)